MFTAYMWCYPWDLIDEGIDRVLDPVQEMGVDGVCVATAYHSIEHLRMHGALDGKPRAYVHPAACYFQPESARYANTRLRPMVAEWLKTRNPLVDVAKACSARGVRLRSWTVCCHNSAIVARRPEVAIKNVFGDTNPTWMCPLNPDVGEYLRALVEDLSSNYGFEAIELESPGFNTSRHYHTHIKIGLQPGRIEQLLLNLCLCESCRQGAVAADVDLQSVAKVAREGLMRWFRDAAADERTQDEFVAAHPALRAFLQWREARFAELIRRIRSSCRCDLVAYADMDVAGSAFDLAGVRDDLSGVVGCCYTAETAAIDRMAGWAAEVMGSKERLSIGLMTYPPGSPDAPTLVRHVHHVAALGVPSVHLYHYGIMPDACFTWVRQALRKPKREG